ncbi:MAG TPA: diguanylate cyclase [Longimicrobiales bacterium]|nr:diguanylate cyclase [Longimicrobiales bacterium]
MLGREHAIGHPALTDERTGLANRLHFELVYSYLFNGADRGVPLTLMLVSTSAPDAEALRALGERIQATTRTSDLVAHLGGGRFIVILLGTNLSGGRIAADRMEMALQGVAVGPVAIGLATYRAEMKESSELLKSVDDALQRAAAAGGGVEL